MKHVESHYQYLDSGLENIYLRNGFEVHETPYGKAVSISNVEGLHRCIAESLVNKPGPLTGPEFKFLRVELDLSQEMMGILLGRKERQVRGWETSDKPVPEPMNTMIRFIYEERFHPDETYEEFSKTIAELQMLDKELFEVRLKSTDRGWERENCKAA